RRKTTEVIRNHEARVAGLLRAPGEVHPGRRVVDARGLQPEAKRPHLRRANFWSRAPSRTSATYRSPVESVQMPCGPQNLPGSWLRSLPKRPITLPCRSTMLTRSSNSATYIIPSAPTYSLVGRSKPVHISRYSPSRVKIWIRLFSRSATYTLPWCSQTEWTVWNRPGLSRVLRRSRALPGSPHDLSRVPSAAYLWTRLLR